MKPSVMRRLRAANPVPTPTRPSDADELFARLLAEPGDTRLTASHRDPIRQRLHALRGLTAARRAVLVLAAAATAAAVVVAIRGGLPTAASGPGNGYAVIEPNVANTLSQLATGSANVAPFTGRYVTLSETVTYSSFPGQTEKITTITDTQTGGTRIYSTKLDLRGGTAAMRLARRRELGFLGLDALVDPQPFLYPGAYASLSTDPTELRAQLLPIGVFVVSTQLGAPSSQQAILNQAILAIERHGTQPASTTPSSATVREEDVYEAASDLLWSPLAPPALRSALYKVLATTRGVTVDTHATDPAGHPAIAMSRAYSQNGKQLRSITYENPTTGAVLAQMVSVHGDTAATTGTSTAIYQPVASTDSAPANPYKN